MAFDILSIIIVLGLILWIWSNKTGKPVGKLVKDLIEKIKGDENKDG